MTPLDPEKLAAALVAGARKYIDAALSPVLERLAAAEARAEAAEAEIAEMVAKAVADIPPPAPGKSVTVEDCQAVIVEAIEVAVKALPQPADGVGISDAMVDAEGRLVLVLDNGTTKTLSKVVGPSVATEEVEAAVSRAVAALPAPEPGKSVTIDELAPVVTEAVAKAVAALPAPKDGAPGKLPLAKAWVDTVHREGDVVTHDGATYQASRDTGKAPPHTDWICLAARGKDGDPADQIEVKGTFDPDANYGRLNIVALQGSAFISRQPNPGPCPGEGWQLIAMRGKEGRPGQSIKGDSVKGDPGPSIKSMRVDDQGLLTLINADGSEVECDLYPVLAKVQG